MLVSIIVPNYNHEKYLVQRLESIFDQTYSNYEVILLDDCSQDNSREILSQYAKKEKVSHCLFNEVNSGNTFKQWAKGIALAKGDLIWIAETDDYCENTFLEKLVYPFQKDPELVLVYSQSNSVNEFGEKTGNWISHTDDLDAKLFLNDFSMNANKFIEEFLICKNVIPNASAVLLKKENILIDEHFDIAPEFKYCGDWMFYFKFIINKKVGFISQPLNNFRYHSTSVIAKALQSEKRIAIIDIDFEMRSVLMDYLKKNKVANYSVIRDKNIFFKRNFLYEKAFLLVRSGKKIKGYFLLLTVLDLFFSQYKLRKNIMIKTKRLFS
ncbi:glycosyltransferase family A protein [Flavobacterium sharifuzzamanii]|uniref:glycosyltransferase family A protein n=1 Tax=Flavobacterium sharifuzzamanii TaxID=2211133 RepID=UPI000DAD1484|nr:glycosyltransferase family 2 protein [Flavobacterium sharifuzzamanii]KAF2081173.1 glycosyltransferase family 2 protein [Flavobacterium sharifuzzamanii]